MTQTVRGVRLAGDVTAFEVGGNFRLNQLGKFFLLTRNLELGLTGRFYWKKFGVHPSQLSNEMVGEGKGVSGGIKRETDVERQR